ncbi:methyltransferase domain-containing protein [Gilvimarinus sp. SDUM040013]|uniref:tRNA 5-carboxymethoxyuridine methyltransferase n=1 Tax=Gilvimarinus gilvus TaxID=3058038 RepID=A0ABU4RWV9_9GAMM|nr:methyltransferase domain-containing protein [Gilvimarinus sp. SDUM040013]MDO3385745.1 methyltransferase domain-containing protein [Gilvimarinus sp. SDUM040013]MDX6849385.1 methyltransferase domain-containing protein [Gilvimarinus sp. SDUM040013]
MPKQAVDADRNFDDLADRFDRNIYGGLKGQIRLAILNRDFSDYLPIAPYVPLTPDKTLSILDAGGGQGQFSIPLAAAGHELTLCDLSQKMLGKARARASEMGLQNVLLKHSSIQSLQIKTQFDLVLCHAVLEWVVEPKAVLLHLWQMVKPGGHVSIIFYNHHSLVYKNLLRTNYKKVLADDYSAFAGSLTPINPLRPEQVLNWCEQLEANLLCHSGIRVFHDYILDAANRQKSPEQVMSLELSLSRQPPFRDLGRYVHLLLEKTHV